MTATSLTPTRQSGQQPAAEARERWVRWAVWAAVWVPGLAVALGAAVATAHGLYEVAVAAGAPQPIAWLYPLITDGLALVAYGSTARLTGGGRTYAWAVVVLAAGLSGLAQASYLAGGVESAPPVLRFGVGAWPAVAAAIVAHLLFLLGTDARPGAGSASSGQSAAMNTAVQPEPVYGGVQLNGQPDAVRLDAAGTGRPDVGPTTSRGRTTGDDHSVAADNTAGVQPSSGRDASPARDRALAAARRYAGRHGRLPTVSQLVALADVARGTAGTALKELRDQAPTLHLVTERSEPST